MFTSTIFSVGSLTSAPRVFPQPLRALAIRRSIQAKLGIAAMASSAGTNLDKTTPDDQWKQVLSTEEVGTICVCLKRPVTSNSTESNFENVPLNLERYALSPVIIDEILWRYP